MGFAKCTSGQKSVCNGGVKVSTKYMRTCFDVVVLYENIRTCLFTCFPVFSPFSAHFYPPLHHNGKGSIIDLVDDN